MYWKLVEYIAIKQVNSFLSILCQQQHSAKVMDFFEKFLFCSLCCWICDSQQHDRLMLVSFFAAAASWLTWKHAAVLIFYFQKMMQCWSVFSLDIIKMGVTVWLNFTWKTVIYYSIPLWYPWQIWVLKWILWLNNTS